MGLWIYDKNGSPLTELLEHTNIFPQEACCDLTVSYDNQADRWIMTILGSNIQVAVSQGPDPVEDGWYIYTLNVNTDYQKLSIWRDGYYMTANTNDTENVHAFERDKMLVGDASAQILGFSLTGIETDGFYSPQAIHISNGDFPDSGGAPIVFLQDDAYSGVDADHLKIWTVDVDWSSPSNSTISPPQELITTAFMSVIDNGAWDNMQQPFGGSAVDAIQGTIMNQAQFRKFPNYNAVVFNFAVDVDPSDATKVGIRWYELRQSTNISPWNIYQEGTHVGANNKDAALGSMIMDSQGNIAMGYSACGGDLDTYMSLYYTGRFANDPLGTMTINETLIHEGKGLISGIRYGDYNKIDIDPVDDKTFWFVGELIDDGRKNYVGVFRIAPNLSNDLGVVSIDTPTDGTLSNMETVAVTIFNYGENPATNFDVRFRIDGGAWHTETYTGTIASATAASYTFMNTADLAIVGDSYTLEAKTNLSNDEDETNDSETKVVRHLYPNDLAITQINSPSTGENLSSNENITVTIMNFGGESQSNFEVSYWINGVFVVETVTGPLLGNSSMEYTFAQTYDMSLFGNYTVQATVLLEDDVNMDNNNLTIEVENSNCTLTSNCEFGDGFYFFEWSTISNTTDCSSTGYSDFTNLQAIVTEGETYPLTLTTYYGDQHVSIWIDFNDDFSFTTDELILQDFILGEGESDGLITETVPLSVPLGVALGNHIMRAKTNWNSAVPEDACEETEYGETEDYMVNISAEGLGVVEDDIANATLIFKTKQTNVFDISLESNDFSEELEVTVHTILGQRIVYHRLASQNGSYHYELDMSYATPGVYIFRIGNDKVSKIKKFIVQ